jgi:hypothetical protein
MQIFETRPLWEAYMHFPTTQNEIYISKPGQLSEHVNSKMSNISILPKSKVTHRIFSEHFSRKIFLIIHFSWENELNFQRISTFSSLKETLSEIHLTILLSQPNKTRKNEMKKKRYYFVEEENCDADARIVGAFPFSSVESLYALLKINTK